MAMYNDDFDFVLKILLTDHICLQKRKLYVIWNYCFVMHRSLHDCLSSARSLSKSVLSDVICMKLLEKCENAIYCLDCVFLW